MHRCRLMTTELWLWRRVQQKSARHWALNTDWEREVQREWKCREGQIIRWEWISNRKTLNKKRWNEERKTGKKENQRKMCAVLCCRCWSIRSMSFWLPFYCFIGHINRQTSTTNAHRFHRSNWTESMCAQQKKYRLAFCQVEQHHLP